MMFAPLLGRPTQVLPKRSYPGDWSQVLLVGSAPVVHNHWKNGGFHQQI